MTKLIEVRVPKVGLDTTEVVLNKWLVKCGDSVRKGLPLAELESEKTTLALESEVEGTVVEICTPEGSTVPIGELVCRIQTTQPGEGKDG
jgi:2-oxoisovalerate dehydrogenase E2 component (dihydrolipoyl transacylase)